MEQNNHSIFDQQDQPRFTHCSVLPFYFDSQTSLLSTYLMKNLNSNKVQFINGAIEEREPSIIYTAARILISQTHSYLPDQTIASIGQQRDDCKFNLFHNLDAEKILLKLQNSDDTVYYIEGSNLFICYPLYQAIDDIERLNKRLSDFDIQLCEFDDYLMQSKSIDQTIQQQIATLQGKIIARYTSEQRLPEIALVNEDDCKWWDKVVYQALYMGNLIDHGDEKWKFYNAFLNQLPSDEDLKSLKVIIFSGSAQSATYDIDWIDALRKFVRKIWNEYPQIKLVGGCFGHQLIAQSLDGKVEKMPHSPVRPKILGREHILMNDQFFEQDFVKEFLEINKLNRENFPPIVLQQSHGEHVVKIPAGATLIGSSESCEVEFYCIGNRALCFQSHPDFNCGLMQEFCEPEYFNQGIITEDFHKIAYENCATMKFGKESRNLILALVRYFMKRSFSQNETPIPIIDRESTSKNIINYIQNQEFEKAIDGLVQSISLIQDSNQLFVLTWSIAAQLFHHQKASILRNFIDYFRDESTTIYDNTKRLPEGLESQNLRDHLLEILAGKKPNNHQRGRPPLAKLPSFDELKIFKEELKKKIEQGQPQFSISSESVKKLETQSQILSTVLSFGNSLELVNVLNMLAVKSKVPLNMGFKQRRCHTCMKPVLKYSNALYCVNVFAAIDNKEKECCQKIMCKDCLGEQWILHENNLFFKCFCCRGQCPDSGICAVPDKIKKNPQDLVNKQIFWYQWRGKRTHVKVDIIQYDKIRKQYKLMVTGSGKDHKVQLEKESFFLINEIPKNSLLQKEIDNKDEVNFKKLSQKYTDKLLIERKPLLYTQIENELKGKPNTTEKKVEVISSESSSQQPFFQDLKILGQPVLGNIGKVRGDDLLNLPSTNSIKECQEDPEVIEEDSKHTNLSVESSPNRIQIKNRKHIKKIMKQKKIDINKLDVSEEYYQKLKRNYYDKEDQYTAKQKPFEQVINPSETGNVAPIGSIQAQEQVVTKRVNLRHSKINTSCPSKKQEITDQLEFELNNLREIAKNYPENLVESPIYVYWPLDELWYRGKILKYLPGSRKFKILYDDQEIEFLDLSKREFQIADQSTEASQKQKNQEENKGGELPQQTPDKRSRKRKVKAKNGKQILGKRTIRASPKIKQNNNPHPIKHQIVIKDNSHIQIQKQPQQQSSQEVIPSKLTGFQTKLKEELNQMTVQVLDGVQIYVQDIPDIDLCDIQQPVKQPVVITPPVPQIVEQIPIQIPQQKIQNLSQPFLAIKETKVHSQVHPQQIHQQIIQQAQQLIQNQPHQYLVQQMHQQQQQQQQQPQQQSQQQIAASQPQMIQVNHHQQQQQHQIHMQNQHQPPQQAPQTVQMLSKQEQAAQKKIASVTSGSFINSSKTQKRTNAMVSYLGDSYQKVANVVQQQSQKSVDFFGNPQDMIQATLNNTAQRLDINTKILENKIQEFDFDMYVKDLLDEFYEKHKQQGYKVCECSNCQKLKYPILIMNHRSPDQYEAIHRKYLDMFLKEQGKEGPHQMEVGEKLNNVKMLLF